MRAKTLLSAAVLAVSLVAVGSAKSWNVVVNSPTMAGAVMLQPGNYNVKLDKANNNQALFTETNSGKKFDVPVKVQNAPHKYDQTQMETQQQGDKTVIQSIDLGGTTEELQFGE